MKRRSLFTAGCLVLAGLLTACSSGSGQKGTTPVTVTVGAGSAAGKTAYQHAIASKATPTIVSVTFTVSGPGMDTIVRVVPITPPQTITEVFYILSGPNRNFFIEAKDGSDNLVYSGGLIANLDGTPLTLSLPLQSMIFNNLIWSPSADEATSITKDLNGNIIIAGHTFGDLNGNLNADRSHGTPDIFVTKLTPTGDTLWTTQTGTTGFDICFSAATDSAGNVYLAGSTDGNLEGETKKGISDAFVMKLDPSGNRLWTRLTGTAGYFTFGKSVTVDGAGNVYIAGNTEGGLVNAQSGTVIPNQDPNNAPQTPGNTYDLFVVKYDKDGNPQWTQQLGVAGAPVDDRGEGIAFSPGAAGPSSVVVAGSTGGPLGGGAYQGRTDMYVVKLDAVSGTVVWTPQQLGTTDFDDAWGVAVDQSTGDIYVSGRTYGGLDGNSNADPSGASADLFVVKYDPAGIKQWTHQLGTAGNEAAKGVAVDDSGNIILTGRTSGDLDLIPSTRVDDDIFVVKYDAVGASTPVWIRQFGTKANDEGVGVVTGINGDIYIAGNTFGGFTSYATQDVILLKYDPAGTVIPPGL